VLPPNVAISLSVVASTPGSATLDMSMPERLIGVTVGADQVNVVLLEKDSPYAFRLDDERTHHHKEGPRPVAYNVLYGQFHDYIQQRRATRVCIKGSAVSLGGTKLPQLHAAELRGVVQAAAAGAGVEVRTATKSVTSRTFGTRKVDEYLKDNEYWKTIGLADLKKGLREAAFAAISGSSV